MAASRFLALVSLALLLTNPAGAQELVPFAEDSHIATRTIADGDSAAGWSVTARIPTLRGPAAADPAWSEFEALLDAVLAAEIDTFLAHFAEWETPHPAMVSSFDAEGVVLWVRPPILSTVLDVSVYYAGAAHPGHYVITLVWDADRRRALTTEDLFAPGSAWPEVVSDATLPALAADLGEMADVDWIAEGAGPDPANFTRWVLVEEGMLVFFDPYQVAPYAAGPQAVAIPYAALADVADPAGPLARR